MKRPSHGPNGNTGAITGQASGFSGTGPKLRVPQRDTERKKKNSLPGRGPDWIESDVATAPLVDFPSANPSSAYWCDADALGQQSWAFVRTT